ncbi:MAG: hypothetical protein M1823_004580 [Watsoniomyces obsoletus]|nr:MAG: hypothetical protein M1823_004580 [Watsoniomyces obsoletus]
MPNQTMQTFQRMRSFGRRKSKSNRQQPDNERESQSINTIQVAELDGASNVELPASPTSFHRPNRRSMPDELTSPAEPHLQANADARHAESDALAKNLVMLQSMQLQSLTGPSHTFVNQDMESVEGRTIHLLEDVITSVRHTKHLSGVEERIAHARDLVYRYRTFESNWIIQVQSSMEKLYRKLRPDASDENISALLNRFDVLISDYLRNRNSLEDRATVRALRDRYQQLLDAKDRLSALAYHWTNAVAEVRSTNMTVSVRASQGDGGPTIIIAQMGDTILEFGFPPRFKFRVSSSSLRQASTFFEYALKPYRQDQMDADSQPPAGLEHDLDHTEFVRSNNTSLMTLRLKLNSHITLEAMTTLLYAAHMRIDRVPRRISFQEFADIAYVCYKYRCTTPVEIFVECFWLEQSYDKQNAEGYEDFLFISYVFGLDRMFHRQSRKALMKLRGGFGFSPEDTKLPQEVWLRLHQVRTAKLRKTLQLCRATLEAYLPSDDLSLPDTTTPDRPISYSENNNPLTANPGLLQLQRRARCRHGSHECDAANLGWLMLVFNTVGVLPAVLDPAKEDEFFQDRAHTLYSIVCKLCAAPSAVGVHGDSCDYAPAFRNAMCDIYNSIRGLNVWDVNDRLTNKRTSMMGYSGVAAVAAADEQIGLRRDIRAVFSGRRSGPRRVSPVGEDRLTSTSTSGVTGTGGGVTGIGTGGVTGSSTVTGPGNVNINPTTTTTTTRASRLSQQSMAASEGNTSMETTSDGITDLTEVSHGSRGSTRLSRQNLQALDTTDRHSVVSTEVDTGTDRPISPTETTASFYTTAVAQQSHFVLETIDGEDEVVDGEGRVGITVDGEGEKEGEDEDEEGSNPIKDDAQTLTTTETASMSARQENQKTAAWDEHQKTSWDERVLREVVMLAEKERLLSRRGLLSGSGGDLEVGGRCIEVGVEGERENSSKQEHGNNDEGNGPLFGRAG